MKAFLQSVLATLAQQVLRRYRPRIIAVTGSIGKTSTKEAIAAVLQGSWPVRQTIKNYNNELGLPLTILGERSGQSNPLAWLGVIMRGIGLAYGSPKSPRYPSVLVLEMGADHPGDISRLVQIAPPEIGVVTGVGPAHLEFFQTLERVAHEKSQIITGLPAHGWAVVNADDDLVLPMREKTEARVLSYGFNEKADVRAHDVVLKTGSTLHEREKVGLEFKVSFQGNVWPVFVPGLIGRHQVYPVIGALAVGLALGLNAVELSQRVKTYRSPAGRMNLIPGIKDTLIIDDSYNSSPLAALAALDTLQHLPATGQKYAVLGDMAELGSYTVPAHQEVGQRAVDCADYIIGVGERALTLVQTAREKGFPEDRLFHFDKAELAGSFLQDRIHQGDLLLVKGSQSVRLEKIVKELMGEPLRAKELLVRQGPEWVK